MVELIGDFDASLRVFGVGNLIERSHLDGFNSGRIDFFVGRIALFGEDLVDGFVRVFGGGEVVVARI